MRERVGLSLFVEMKFVERKFIKTNKNQFSFEKIAAYMRASDGMQCGEEIMASAAGERNHSVVGQ